MAGQHSSLRLCYLPSMICNPASPFICPHDLTTPLFSCHFSQGPRWAQQPALLWVQMTLCFGPPVPKRLPRVPEFLAEAGTLPSTCAYEFSLQVSTTTNPPNTHTHIAAYWPAHSPGYGCWGFWTLKVTGDKGAKGLI